MIKLFNLFAVNLKLFDGGAAGAGSGTGSGAAQAGTGQTENNGSSGGSHQGKTGDKVIYGKQQGGSEAGAQGSSGSDGQQTKGQEAGGQQTQLTPEQRRAEFDKLISGDYKDLFAERTQSIIDRRFRDTKLMEGRMGSLQPAIDILMSRYNVKAEKDLADAILQDDMYLQDAADEAGMSVEQYRKFLQTNAENKRLRDYMNHTEAQRQAAVQYSKWDNEALKLIGTPEAPGPYPGLDLQAESANPQFKAMLDSLTRAGFPNPVQRAYETLHMDEITAGVARTTAKKVESNVTENLRAKGSRPAENGTSNQSGVIVKNDVRQLSREDRREIAKRANRGENISF
jgi:hypothetical protein